MQTITPLSPEWMLQEHKWKRGDRFVYFNDPINDDTELVDYCVIIDETHGLEPGFVVIYDSCLGATPFRSDACWLVNVSSNQGKFLELAGWIDYVGESYQLMDHELNTIGVLPPELQEYGAMPYNDILPHVPHFNIIARHYRATRKEED